MADEFPIITTRQYEAEATKWLEAIGRGEDISVVFFPKTDRSIRLGQLLNDSALINKILGDEKKYIFVRINFDEHDVEDNNDFQFQLQERLNFLKLTDKTLTFDGWMDYLARHNLHLVLILPEAEKYLTEAGKTVLTVMSYFSERYGSLMHFISLFEKNIADPSLSGLLPSSASLYENIFYYPLYDAEANVAFIHMIAQQWEVVINNKIAEEILKACGGHFWLIKEGLRHMAAGQKWSYSHEGMQFRLRSIYNLLLESEQKVLQNLAHHRTISGQDQQISLQYLQTMRVITADKKLLIGAFSYFFEHQAISDSRIALKDNHVLVNNVPVEKMFSRKEYRIMKLLLERQSNIVTREELGEVIWADKADYSDWAIDQLVARVRKRLVQLSLPPRLIEVVRGKGYIINKVIS